MTTTRAPHVGRAWMWTVSSRFLSAGVLIRHVRGNVRMGDHIMSESRDASLGQSVTETTPKALTSDERWAQWQEKGARHDARVARKMRLVAAIALAIGVVWASVSLL